MADSNIPLISEMTQTLFMLFISSGLAELLIAFRLVLRRVRGQEWNLSDYLTRVCMLCLLARISMVHVVLLWDTNNFSIAYRKGHIFSETKIYQREIGRKLILASKTLQQGVSFLLSD